MPPNFPNLACNPKQRDQAGRGVMRIHFKADDLVGHQTGRRVADVVWNKAVSYIRRTETMSF